MTSINGREVVLKNHKDGSYEMADASILSSDMWSADHFDTEVKCTMTDLSTIIQSCGDTVFTVRFSKKIDCKQVEENLKNADLSSSIKTISKGLIEGEKTEITGYLVESCNILGRSVVIDLNAEAPNNFRQVDHRTIEYIIFRNVKYTLGKKVAGTEDFPLKAPQGDKWTRSKLAVGNWFSFTGYFKYESESKDIVVFKSLNSVQ